MRKFHTPIANKGRKCDNCYSIIDKGDLYYKFLDWRDSRHLYPMCVCKTCAEYPLEMQVAQ